MSLSVISTIREIYNIYNKQPICVCRYCRINFINFSNFELGYYLFEIQKLEYLRPMCKECFVKNNGIVLIDMYDEELKNYLHNIFNLKRFKYESTNEKFMEIEVTN